MVDDESPAKEETKKKEGTKETSKLSQKEINSKRDKHKGKPKTKSLIEQVIDEITAPKDAEEKKPKKEKVIVISKSKEKPNKESNKDSSREHKVRALTAKKVANVEAKASEKIEIKPKQALVKKEQQRKEKDQSLMDIKIPIIGDIEMKKTTPKKKSSKTVDNLVEDIQITNVKLDSKPIESVVERKEKQKKVKDVHIKVSSLENIVFIVFFTI